MEELKTDTRTVVIYEAPHHLISTLKDLHFALGERKIAICRELTKRFETAFRTTLSEAAAWYETHEARGECVIVMERPQPGGAGARAAAELGAAECERAHGSTTCHRGHGTEKRHEAGGEGTGASGKEKSISSCWPQRNNSVTVNGVNSTIIFFPGERTK